MNIEALHINIGRSLLANNFVRVDGHYENDLCKVYFIEYGYAVYADGGVMYSQDFNIYWLLGVLTYYNYMPRDYKTV
jgi:hypothetical protein